MEFTQILTVRKLSLRRSIYGVRVRVTRPNSEEIGRLNLAQLKLILSRLRGGRVHVLSRGVHLGKARPQLQRGRLWKLRLARVRRSLHNQGAILK